MSRPECGVHACGRGGASSTLRVLVFVLAALELCSAPASAEKPPPDAPQYRVVHPVRVDVRGHFLSNFLSHHARRLQRREASAAAPADLDRVFYRLRHDGRSLRLNLTLNPRLLGPGFLTERRFGGLSGAEIRPPASSQCHFFGEVWDEAVVKGNAAISTCDGLTGIFRLSNDEFFIQPLEKSNRQTSAPQAHAVYRRHATPPSWSPVVRPISGTPVLNGSCGVTNSRQRPEDAERQRERWENRQRKRRRVRKRSISKERWVETLVVADPKMVEYHGSKGVENYVLAVMNIVAGLFLDASIGNAINIVVVRLILLERDEDNLKITHHADNSLNSFCKWQKQLNMKGDDHPLHHDVAVLLTRKDICAAINTPCETLGLSHVAGMCQAHRSCSISEDTGLPLAFTVAHELGHNFGIQHDGNGNDCEPIGKRPFVMSPQLLYGTSLPRWSRCSRQYITRFLDRGWGWCLDDAPLKDKLSLSLVLPGVLYGAAHQCRLQYGSASLVCDDMDNVCSTLWCTVGTTCHSKLDGAVDGTSCGEDKWCFSGECVAIGYEPASVSGGWASWSEWSSCSRSCGAGVQSARRDCDNPTPKHRGKYCLGERQRYRICNTMPCPGELPTFRDLQCSQFDTMLYKGRLYKWVAVINRVSPCELHCRPLNEHFSEKMRDAVADGTPCFEGNKSREMCINGICKNIGCDFVIESSAVEDRCGVCHGNGSTCRTVRKTFQETEGLGYVDIGLIPAGAWDIRIEEVAEAGNFLALRSDNPNKYFLNGGWTIQWNGEYKAAGAVFTYERTGHLENLTSPGPTMEPLWIQLLFQEANPGVRYEYTVSRNVSGDKDVPLSVFSWKHGSWTECSATCGRGVQRQIVHCVERTTGIAEERFCDPLTRPDDNQTSCHKEPCPAKWWSGEWQKCSSSCGSSGLARRTVLCIQAISVEEQESLSPDECKHLPEPESLSSCNAHIPCPADWTAGGWSKCSLTCGVGVRRRNVTCSRNTGVDCDLQAKPPAVAACHVRDCPPDNFGNVDSSGSGWSSIEEVFNEVNSIPAVMAPPKHGPARAQPRHGANDIDGDFHYHNNIESVDNSLGGGEHVDDFYYDYNFINFHEDLSDDGDDSGQEFDSEREAGPTSGESTRAPAVSSPSAAISEDGELTPEPRNTDPDDEEDNGEPATDESPQVNSENWDDFLSEDHLLPVSTAQSLLFPTTEKPNVSKDGRDDPFRTETPNSPTRPGRTAERNSNHPTAEEGGRVEDFTVTPEEASFNPETTMSALDPHLQHGYDDMYTPGFSARPSGFSSPDLEGGVESGTAFETPERNTQPSASSSTAPQPDDEGNRFNEDTSTAGERRLREPDLAATSAPAPESPTLLPSPFALTSGTKFLPLSEMETSTATPADDFQAPPTGRTPTRTDPSSQRSRSHLPPSNPPASDTPAAPPPVTDPPRPTPPPPRPGAAHWVAGNWSTCSTTCGLGAIWRTLACSTGAESDCDPAKMPTPAQRCYLRPCSMWKVGEWSKCSRNCGDGGVKSRDVQCFDMRDERPLRPFHCRAMSSRPQTQIPCNGQPCLDWYSSSWGECSEVCGGGEQQRIVTCPEEDQCDRDLQPGNIRPCNSQPCAQWLTGSWGQCSVSCGGGAQSRLIKCVNTKAETEEVVDPAECHHQPQPENTRRCETDECEGAAPEAPCLRDRITARLCQTLRWMSRCHLPNVRAQCCKTCSRGRHANTTASLEI